MNLSTEQKRAVAEKIATEINSQKRKQYKAYIDELTQEVLNDPDFQEYSRLHEKLKANPFLDKDALLRGIVETRKKPLTQLANVQDIYREIEVMTIGSSDLEIITTKIKEMYQWK